MPNYQLSIERLRPAKLALPIGPERVALGRDVVCALAKGTWWCLGSNHAGTIRGVDETSVVTPARMTTSEPLALRANGELFTCGVALTGRVHFWSREFTDGRLREFQGPGVEDAQKLVVGSGVACVLTGGGTVQCLDSNGRG